MKEANDRSQFVLQHGEDEFNRDGLPDLVVPTQNNSKVNVLLGSGNGAFLAATSFTAGTNPYSVAVSDLNDDGRSDLVVANAGSSSVSTLFGDGGGAFQLASSYPVGSSPAFVAAADFNQDGKPDLAVANSDSSNVSILLNAHLSCANSFTTPLSYPVGSTPAAVIALDLNNDGRTDIATANAASSSVSVLLGNGLGIYPNQSVGYHMDDFTRTPAASPGMPVSRRNPGHASALK